AQQEEELVVARKIDPQLIEYQEKRFSHSNSNRVVIDDILSQKELWHKVFAESERREALGSSLWRIVLRGIPLKYGTFVFIIVCLVISFLFLQSSQRRLTALCIKCGKPIKRFGGGGSGSLPDICSNCISVIVGDKKVSQQSKEKKMAQIKEYEKRQDLIWKCLTFGIPGGGHLRLGCPWLAVAILFTFFCFVTKALLWNGLLSDPLWLSGGSGGFTIGAFIISFLGFYGLSVMSSYHQKMRRSGFSDAFRIIRQREREQEGNRTGRGGDR
ncbi:MAG: hypothetical protein JXD19_10660, partial [Deltaproteobacteria bacterium]|nr:hypothetical protein [Deltaproteobacteria bacterium]